MKSLIFLLPVLLLWNFSVNGQFSENFDQNTTTLSNNCWVLNQINYSTTSGDVINGTGSAYTNPPTSGSSDRSLATPFLNMSSPSLTVSFLYKTSSKIAGNATRTINIGIVDRNGLFTSLELLTMDKNTATSVLAHNATYLIPTTGIYRLEIRIGGATGDGNSRVIFDDLNISASPIYGPTSHCNQPATAINDNYYNASISTTTGNVLTNDQFPSDNEIYTSTVVSAPTSGTLVLNADGTFTYTPDPYFTSGLITFTYQVSDNGFPSATSNVATVTINFPSPVVLPVKLVSFVGAKHGDNVKLSWEVKDVHEGNYFEVEKSTDGKNYSLLTKVGANVHTANYAAADYRFTKNTYYRLKTVNSDQTITYSNVVLVKFATNNEVLTVLGSQVSAVLKLRVADGIEANLVQVFSVSGAKLVEMSTNAGNIHAVNVQSLSAGVYVVSVVSKSGRYAAKFVKS